MQVELAFTSGDDTYRIPDFPAADPLESSGQKG
jgi:hypothetical protein